VPLVALGPGIGTGKLMQEDWLRGELNHLAFPAPAGLAFADSPSLCWFTLAPACNLAGWPALLGLDDQSASKKANLPGDWPAGAAVFFEARQRSNS